MNIMDQIVKENARQNMPEFRPGDTVRVHVKIQEGDKERLQVFEGVVLRRRRGGAHSTFTVRKVSYGVGVERVFPTNSPSIERVDVVARGKVRRSRLYYLRELRGKKARIETRTREELEAKAAANETAETATESEG
jgi:large subunit ribosomal protein L19